jgi:hypothetical protein
LLDGAGVVLLGGLGRETGGGAVLVEVAALVHGLLEAVALPAEDVVTVGSRATARLVSHVPFDIPPSHPFRRGTYPRFMLYIKAGPESGQMLLSEKLVTFHMSSYMIWGSLTGWVLGQAPPPVAPEPWP